VLQIQIEVSIFFLHWAKIRYWFGFFIVFWDSKSLKLKTAETNRTLNFISNYLFVRPLLATAFYLILICYFLISPITEQEALTVLNIVPNFSIF
jgi:hypothetical protein